ncbi:MAG: FKBP-type peptidyl-prolyl cis-trans isomerase [Thermoplasmatota archaeon]
MAVKDGDFVKVDYTGRLEDGTIFDSSIEEVAKKSNYYDENRNYEPLGFTVGQGELIPGFEDGVKGMSEGEKKEVEIPPEEGYGKKGDHPLAGKTLIFEIEVKEIHS